MLSKNVEKALNGQIALEAYASSSYLAMASWSEGNGLRGSAEFFYAQSAEEREHMLRLVKYVNEASGHAHIPAIKEPPCSYKSLNETFEIALQQEKNVTESINKLVELCFNSKDYASFNFLQWYVAEQHEEESLFMNILDLFKISGAEPKNLLLVDKEIKGMHAAAEK